MDGCIAFRTQAHGSGRLGRGQNLGNDNDDGYWSDTLTLRTTMLREIEAYQIRLFCRTGRNTLSRSSAGPLFTFFTSKTQGTAFVGNFSLDYLPVSIVYCPPNQDMSASLTQSLQYGTRMTIGTSLALPSRHNSRG